jgi:hypothetical protein
VYGDHSTQCHGGGSLHRRHDRLKVVLYAALRSGGCSPQLEPPHLIPGRLTRPGDVYVPVGDNGLGVAYDVTVIYPLLGPNLASTARTPGHAVTAAEQRKASLYTSVCAAVDIRFIPLAQETFGGWSDMASHQICLIADLQADRTGAPVPALFVPERPVPCTSRCRPKEHRSGCIRPVRSTPRTCPPFAPLS